MTRRDRRVHLVQRKAAVEDRAYVREKALPTYSSLACRADRLCLLQIPYVQRLKASSFLQSPFFSILQRSPRSDKSRTRVVRRPVIGQDVRVRVKYAVERAVLPGNHQPWSTLATSGMSPVKAFILIVPSAWRPSPNPRWISVPERRVRVHSTRGPASTFSGPDSVCARCGRTCLRLPVINIYGNLCNIRRGDRASGGSLKTGSAP